MLVDGINVLKKPFIDAYAEELKKISKIKGLIIFGSAVTERCREDSDVDCIIICTNEDMWNCGYELFQAYEKATDIMHVEQDLLSIPDMQTFYSKQTLLFEHLRESGEYKIIFERK